MSLRMDFMFNDLAMSDLINGLNPSDEIYEQFIHSHRLYRLYFDAAIEGWAIFDWDKAHKLGWFSLNDYRIFEPLKKYKEEL